MNGLTFLGLRRHVLLASCIVALTFSARATLAAENDVAQCARTKVAFDGIEPLRYTTINANRQIGQALAEGNMAQVWYILRYVAANPTQSGSGNVLRDYVESQMFGLNGASSTGSVAEAFRDYQVLTEHREIIISHELRFGANPDENSPETAAVQISKANNTFLPHTGQQFVNHGPNAQAPLTTPVQTLAQIFDPEARVILDSLRAIDVLPQLELDTFGQADTSASPFLVRSTDIYVASDSNREVNAGTGDGLSVGGLAQASRNHIVNWHGKRTDADWRLRSRHLDRWSRLANS
jgi:hypothetical protein